MADPNDIAGMIHDRINEIYDTSANEAVTYGDDISGAGLIGGADATISDNIAGPLLGGQSAGIQDNSRGGLLGGQNAAISGAPPKPRSGGLGGPGAAFRNPTPDWEGAATVTAHQQPGPVRKVFEATKLGQPGIIENAGAAVGVDVGPVGRLFDQVLHLVAAGRSAELVVLRDQIDQTLKNIPMVQMLHPETQEKLRTLLHELAGFVPATAPGVSGGGSILGKTAAVAKTLARPDIEPPVASGFIRLYRGEGRPDRTGPIWEDPEMNKLAGRWFTPNIELAHQFGAEAKERGLGPGKVIYVDVPASVAKEHNAAGSPFTYGFPNESAVILPQEWVSKAKKADWKSPLLPAKEK